MDDVVVTPEENHDLGFVHHSSGLLGVRRFMAFLLPPKTPTRHFGMQSGPLDTDALTGHEVCLILFDVAVRRAGTGHQCDRGRSDEDMSQTDCHFLFSRWLSRARSICKVARALMFGVDAV